MELTADIHHEDGSYWAEVSELPGQLVPAGSLRVRAAVLSDAASA